MHVGVRANTAFRGFKLAVLILCGGQQELWQCTPAETIPRMKFWWQLLSLLVTAPACMLNYFFLISFPSVTAATGTTATTALADICINKAITVPIIAL